DRGEGGCRQRRVDDAEPATDRVHRQVQHLHRRGRHDERHERARDAAVEPGPEDDDDEREERDHHGPWVERAELGGHRSPTREPPRAEIRNPARMAVNSPRSGLTPLAIAKAMARGSATIPTMIPALRSARNCSRLYPPRNVVTSFGTSLSRFPGREATQRI